jgi:hypothetical protein
MRLSKLDENVNQCFAEVVKHMIYFHSIRIAAAALAAAAGVGGAATRPFACCTGPFGRLANRGNKGISQKPMS